MAPSPGRVTWVLASLLAATPSAATEIDDADRARTHFEVGRGLYKLGNYAEAIREFTAGYALIPKPGFLLNLAQAHRRLNHLNEARAFCEKYLADAPPDEPNREQGRALLVEIESEMATAPTRA